MPYIKKERRAELQPMISYAIVAITDTCTPGDLNYIITQLAREYILAKGKTYAHINDVLGALEGAKQEFYRRVAAPYEEKKIQENGDVYYEGGEDA